MERRRKGRFFRVDFISQLCKRQGRFWVHEPKEEEDGPWLTERERERESHLSATTVSSSSSGDEKEGLADILSEKEKGKGLEGKIPRPRVGRLSDDGCGPDRRDEKVGLKEAQKSDKLLGKLKVGSVFLYL